MDKSVAPNRGEISSNTGLNTGIITSRTYRNI
jgi:hypothetical protein